MLKFYHLHTHEKGAFAYKVDGRYDPEQLKKIDWILRDWRESEAIKIDPRLLDLIWEAYQQSGSKDYIRVICGYRSPGTNAMLRSRSSGVARKSQHMLGRALDFYIPDVPLKTIREIGLKMQFGGVGFYPHSGSPFVHLDVGNARHWPRMSRKELVAVFPQGGTVHVPSDGRPLPGYDRAIADYKQRRAQSEIQVANARDTSSGGSRSLLAMLFGKARGDDTGRGVTQTPVAGADAALPRARPVEPSPTAVAAAAGLDPAEVPYPTSAPDRSRMIAAAQEMPAAATALAEPARPDEIGRIVAALETQRSAVEAGGELAFVPTPTGRPQLAAALLETASASTSSARAAGSAREFLVSAAAPARPRNLKTSLDEARSLSQEQTDKAAAVTEAAMRQPEPGRAPSADKSKAFANTHVPLKGGRILTAAQGLQGRSGAADRQLAIAARIELAALVTDPGDRAAPALRDGADAAAGGLRDAMLARGFMQDGAGGKTGRIIGSPLVVASEVGLQP
ncbi:DUF882 domain-containing protein [Jiella sp. M17.18]|uniref:DUF882 domain-containing protein n=1 Tax=Jiella sp. M17.18 TaxID=3234247 RepID=UPI0034DFFB58